MIKFLIFLILFLSISVAYVILRLPLFTKQFKVYRKTIFGFLIVFVLFFLFVLLFIGKPHHDYKAFRLFFYVNFIFVFVLIPLLTYFVLYLLTDGIIISVKIFYKKQNFIKFRRILHRVSTTLIFIFWIMLIYGNLYGKSDFVVKKYQLSVSQLPQKFNGLKILHFSDTHLGSFFNTSIVEKGIDIITQQNADIVLFTGDFVNISADEAKPFVSIFQKIKAPLGKYAVLGNHDMSDYRKFDINRDSLNVNINEIVNILNEMNFVVLRDTAIILKRENDKIAIAGTDNWGKPPFKQYGNLQKTMSTIDSNIFTILLTHDASLWLEKGHSYKNIYLTLSGHTHGMQLGINTSWLKWTPAQYIYKYAIGLYSEQGQFLYINPGFGFIGIPVRIGIKPEITVITLLNSVEATQ